MTSHVLSGASLVESLADFPKSLATEILEDTFKVGPYDRYKWGYIPYIYIWHYKWVSGVITPMSEVTTPFITGSTRPTL